MTSPLELVVGRDTTRKNPIVCPKCHLSLTPGKAIAQTFTSGMSDFGGADDCVTMSPGGPGRLIDCLKCRWCGWSVTKGKT